jgi:type II secretory pathway pseudopilin PulG
MKAFTLVELLVAISLFLLLGLLLFTVLQHTIYAWHYTESQKELNAAARHIFAYLREDIEAIYSSATQPKDTPLWLDYDTKESQRLRFVRRLDTEHTAILRCAGNEPVSAGYAAYFREPPEAGQKLRALGGLGEVVYALIPKQQGGELWRGLQAPPGGPQSFLQHDNSSPVENISRLGHRLSDAVLHWHIRCWSHRTRKWDELTPLAAGGSPPLWDSTLTSPPLLPCKVQITIVLRGTHQLSAVLAEEISDHDSAIPLRQRQMLPAPAAGETAIALIGRECITYTEARAGLLTGVKRGTLGSRAQKHEADTSVQVGQRFTTTIHLPISQPPWDS